MNPVLVMAAVASAAGLLAAGLVSRRGVRLDAPHADDAMVRRELWLHPAAVLRLRRRPPAGPLTGAALVLGATLLTGVAAVVGVIALMITTESGLARSDLPLARWAREHASPTSVDILRGVSTLGGTGCAVLVAVLLVAVGVRRRQRPAAAAFVALAIFGQFAIVNATKWLIDRARPDLAPLTGYAGASFPSGHAAAAAAVWASAALFLGRGRSRRLRALIVGVSTAIAVAVGITRIFLGVHWFTDVLAGLVLGWGWFAACSVAFGGTHLHFGEPIEIAEDMAAGDGPPPAATGPAVEGGTGGCSTPADRTSAGRRRR